jgi:hypothetical protein
MYSSLRISTSDRGCAQHGRPVVKTVQYNDILLLMVWCLIHVAVDVRICGAT